MADPNDQRDDYRKQLILDMLSVANRYLITDRNWALASQGMVSSRTILRMRKGTIPTDDKLNELRKALIKEAENNGITINLTLAGIVTPADEFTYTNDLTAIDGHTAGRSGEESGSGNPTLPAISG